MSGLLGFRADLYAAAHYSRELASYLAANGLRFTDFAPFVGTMALTRCRYFKGRRFDFDSEGRNSIVIEVLADDGETIIDLCAWPVDVPDKHATACGVAKGLGGWHIANSATYFLDRPLRIWRSPLTWLRNGCQGAVILDESRAGLWLADALGPIAAEDVDHGRRLLSALAPWVPMQNIVVPDPRRVAA